jgi:hypothetical protein
MGTNANASGRFFTGDTFFKATQSKSNPSVPSAMLPIDLGYRGGISLVKRRVRSSTRIVRNTLLEIHSTASYFAICYSLQK